MSKSDYEILEHISVHNENFDGDKPISISNIKSNVTNGVVQSIDQQNCSENLKLNELQNKIQSNASLARQILNNPKSSGHNIPNWGQNNPQIVNNNKSYTKRVRDS
jgi:hypothetical protein